MRNRPRMTDVQNTKRLMLQPWPRRLHHLYCLAGYWGALCHMLMTIPKTPEIVKNMSADSRVYFDMIMDGQVSVDNKDFLNMAAAVMAWHLQSHPEDMARVIALFDEKQIPHEILKQHMQNKKQK